ncbi:hypothetical protein ARMA_1779 [Ardenticatena maritima]|uniref:Uncharacterized protein n=1 Tax=Ardenticatena maritima TaxID=872965 RepID=A0A0M8KA24_9CHLR|nr:hypothetical protein ARMA_1779 [Ardenticatena maritima]
MFFHFTAYTFTSLGVSFLMSCLVSSICRMQGTAYHMC